ncbi:MAG: hypothetical protein L0I80_04370 [Brevibacterium sp.]|uniref:lantibiotic dehydratase C-terminal domain-containing protein n=1 Tax=Brevibacterium sp. TaxID=1701 RepID=UPI0026497D89|nr:lantibiotic dehydratase C-terminal domain-containing protein [Brevibacterium sp.]MDN5806070.1 hypothetical protein [Brevibacterium sp.]MDN5833929.1 hypothetical protein [Brevibacterium sp.]MDN5910159.1 hypothetical protein [Brevibacterium sp.]MDN6123092.1 hypothetical protein [Brevibacterium sp.]MDN6134762.1 hypothetical protein [Brevibacterium sp.]
MKISTSNLSLTEQAQLRAGHTWRAYHIYYGGSPLVLLSDCVVPLAERLREEELISEYFYINYWLQGSHVRLRVRVPDDIGTDTVDHAVLDSIRYYLCQEPSLHPMAELSDNDFYNQLFAGEFAEADRPKYFTENNEPIFAENNSVEIRDYAPEWDRYGGERGMLISEWFFVRSTAQVVDLMKLGNLGVRTILLGIATQMTALTAVCMLRDLDTVKDFFIAYHRRWIDGYDNNPAYGTPEGRREHAGTTQAIQQLIIPHLRAAANDRADELPPVLRNWVEVCLTVREAIEDAYEQGPLHFEYTDGNRAAATPHEAAWSLCHSFIHMTNNRMMVSVADEAFIAYQIVAALQLDESHDD